MSEGSNGGSNSALYFIAGALAVVVGLGAFVYSGGYFGPRGGKTTTEKTTTSVPAVGGSTTTTTTTEKSKP